MWYCADQMGSIFTVLTGDRVPGLQYDPVAAYARWATQASLLRLVARPIGADPSTAHIGVVAFDQLSF